MHELQIYLRDREKVGKSVLVLNIIVMEGFLDFVGVVVYKLLNCVVDELKPSILFHACILFGLQ